MHTQQNSLIKEHINLVLYRVFLYYCSLSQRDNYQSLKLQNYKQLLEDSHIIGSFLLHQQSISKNSSRIPTQDDIVNGFDILFCKQKDKKTNGINYNNFKYIFQQIVSWINAEQQDITYQQVVLRHFKPLYQFIYEQTQYGYKLQLINSNHYSQQCFKFLNKKLIKQSLFKIYQSYFHIANKLGQTTTHFDIFDLVKKFLKDFEIAPQQISIVIAYVIFQHVMQEVSETLFEEYFTSMLQKDIKLNKHMNFFKFLKILINISRLIYEEDQLYEGLKKFVQKMAMSKGYKILQKQTKLILILEQDSTRKLPIVQQQDPQIQTIKDFLNKSDLTLLQKKFNQFCIHGLTKNQAQKLTRKKISNIVFSAQLVQENLRNEAEIDIILKSLGNKYSFNDFVKFLFGFAKKFRLQFYHVVQKINRIKMYDEGSIQTLKMQEAYQEIFNEEVIGFLELAFIVYATDQKLNLNTYTTMLLDFELCPLFIAKDQIKSIFQKVQLKLKMSIKPFLTIQTFVNSLAILADSTNDGSKHKSLHLFSLLQMMNNSRGKRKILRATNNLNQHDFLIQTRKQVLKYKNIISPTDKKLSKYKKIL